MSLAVIQQFTTIKKIMVCSSLCNLFFSLTPRICRQIKKKIKGVVVGSSGWWWWASRPSLWHAPCSHFFCVCRVCSQGSTTAVPPTGDNISLIFFLSFFKHFFSRILRLETRGSKGGHLENHSPCALSTSLLSQHTQLAQGKKKNTVSHFTRHN